MTADLYQDPTILLSMLLVGCAGIQVIFLFFSCGLHPKVEKKGFKQSLKQTRSNFNTLMKAILLNTNEQHHEIIFKKWLLIDKMNVNNYSLEDHTEEDTFKQVGGRDVRRTSYLSSTISTSAGRASLTTEISAT